jgi:predicted DNA-binding transcriptional regulator AlpA
MLNPILSDEPPLLEFTLEEVAQKVAVMIVPRLTAKDVLKLLQIVFLEVQEVAQLLRVKERTIYTWISQGRIPVRYANGKPLFLLAEIIQWTLPADDKHSGHRLLVATYCSIAASRLAAIREGE